MSKLLKDVEYTVGLTPLCDKSLPATARTSLKSVFETYKDLESAAIRKGVRLIANVFHEEGLFSLRASENVDEFTIQSIFRDAAKHSDTGFIVGYKRNLRMDALLSPNPADKMREYAVFEIRRPNPDR
ncbi:MAG: hypothetical protein H6867_11050 [Rhodospirillales bacterium]|nr:hypothetical protein [Rhodospirillales bacterium]MCB9996666.1 hypothetical protein [Rhodospirillales bacterium]